ncbi:MAG: hypothetical protein R3321_12955 [Nitrososphaeraceae archaeon]|nr:hypothetical protein [Nitrososphaeraceae archaeon]
MICNNCSRVKDIPSCVDAIVIGTISSLTTAVYIYFQDQRGVVNRLTSTTSGAGLITLDLTDTGNDDFRIVPNMLYDVWVTLQSATSITDKEDITVSGDNVNTYDCVSLKAEKIRDEADVITITSETLVLVS